MAKIESPVPGFNGVVVGVAFSGGVAETTNQAAISYFRRHRYGVNGPPPESSPATVDSRDVTTQTVGTRLRDAAVDPRHGDFLAPTNAGKADPHGPDVVAPGIHGTPPGPPRPGKVSDDPKVQDAAETAHAARVHGVDIAPPDPYATPPETATPAESTESTDPSKHDGTTADPAAPTADELEAAHTKPELFDLAAEAGVDVPKKATKAEVAAAIVAARD